MTTQELTKIQDSEAAMVRQDFGGSQVTRLTETAATAVAAQVKAAIEARYVMALRRPRDIDLVRSKLLKECERPGFAAEAWYRKPVGKKFNEVTERMEESYAEGPSIRFAEAAIRVMGNMALDTFVIYDDASKRIVRQIVTDLESNSEYSLDITLDKTIERRNLKKGQKAIRTRINSYGDTVYIVEATEDELKNKQAAEVSKAIRTNGLRFVPGDVIDDCRARVEATLTDAAAKDPDEARKKLIDAFSALSILPDQLAQYLGHPISQVQPKQIVELRRLYAAIRDGEATWMAVMESKSETAAEKTGEAKAAAGPPKSLNDVVAKEKAAKEQAPAKKDEPPHPADDEAQLAADALRAELKAKEEEATKAAAQPQSKVGF